MENAFDQISRLKRQSSLGDRIWSYIERQKEPSVIDVDTLEQALAEHKRGGQSSQSFRLEIVDFLRKCADAGAGRFLVGRREHKSRLEFYGTFWKQYRKGCAEERSSDASFKSSTRELSPNGTVRYPLPLRANFTAEIVVPENITAAELERLAGLIKLLPIKS